MSSRDFRIRRRCCRVTWDLPGSLFPVPKGERKSMYIALSWKWKSMVDSWIQSKRKRPENSSRPRQAGRWLLKNNSTCWWWQRKSAKVVRLDWTRLQGMYLWSYEFFYNLLLSILLLILVIPGSLKGMKNLKGKWLELRLVLICQHHQITIPPFRE